MKYIDSEKLIAEIEGLLKLAQNKEENEGDFFFSGEIQGYKNIITIIDSLQREQPEVDFEKETKRWWKEHLHLNPENKLWMDAHQSVVFARHFFELGRNERKEDTK
jgi:hypothetical protein